MPDAVRVIDTSVLLRYLTGDNVDMQARARRVIDSGQPLGITAVALLEASYALQHYYGYSRTAIVDALVDLVTRRNFVGVGIDLDQAAAKLMLCRSSTAVSFGDALLAALAASAGLDTVYTFDEKMGRAGIIALAP